MSRVLRAFLVISSISSCLPLCTQAHMQMSWPYPLRSPLDPEVPVSLKNYNNINPLAADGSDFPCKHFQYNDTNPQAYDIKAAYQAGSAYNLSLAGVATHMGGSCQISLSYDNGATFKVIESIIGGCPLTPNYNFTIPSFAPSSDTVLLSWSWFNLIGNREMYQNCARVSIQNQNQPIQRYRRAAYKRQASLNDLPDMFACNVGNGCTTIEHSEVVFPNPGPNVIYGQDATTPNPGPGFTINGATSGNATTSAIAQTTTAPYAMYNITSLAGPTGSGTGYFNYNSTLLTSTLTSSSSTSLPILTTSFVLAGSSSTSTSSAPSTSTSTSTSSSPSSVSSNTSTVADSPSVVTITVTVTVPPAAAASTTVSRSTFTTSTTLRTTVIATSLPIAGAASTLVSTSSISSALRASSTTTALAAPSASSTLTLPCTPGAFACNSASTFSQCVSNGSGSTSYTYMGSVAAGMQCSNGQIIRQNEGPCTPNGQIFCNGGNAFFMCNQGGLVSMGPVASGSQCVNGSIVAV